MTVRNAKLLTRLLHQRDRRAAELAAIDKRIAEESRVYWAAQGLRANPRPERLRAELLS